MYDWSPKQIVEELDRYIIGQDDAKRAVAVALRNRYRRSKIDPSMRDEITPKNIIMMGPTGCGKTEIARRLAKLVEAPFVKVEATKFTEVGYVGRDVDSIIRDLMEASIHLVKNQKQSSVEKEAAENAEKRLVKALVPVQKQKEKKEKNPLELLLGQPEKDEEAELNEEEKKVYSSKKDTVLNDLRAGKLEDEYVTIEIEEQPKLNMDMAGGQGMNIDIGNIFGKMMPKNKRNRKCRVSEAREILLQEEVDRLIDMDDVIDEAVRKAEQDGIIFIDEMDKVAGRSGRNGPDVSREGVQRDILPIVEGSTVTTKYGPVKTDFMLFIAAGAFHMAKVTDLIPELQGRFPIQVELAALTKEDFINILHQTDNAITKQYSALLAVDNIDLEFTEDALDALAEYAALSNEINENIGARRLHTVMETLLQDISFNASGQYPMATVVINKQYVDDHLGALIPKKSLKKYII